jgi:hypothetical protein
MTNLTVETISTSQILLLEGAAASALDRVMVGVCQIARTGAFEGEGLTDDERDRLGRFTTDSAKQSCADVINYAARI